VCSARAFVFGRDVRLRACVFYEHMSVMPAGGGLGKTSTRLCARWSIGFALAHYPPYSRMRELIMHRRLEFLPLLFYFICAEKLLLLLFCHVRMSWNYYIKPIVAQTLGWVIRDSVLHASSIGIVVVIPIRSKPPYRCYNIIMSDVCTYVQPIRSYGSTYAIGIYLVYLSIIPIPTAAVFGSTVDIHRILYE